MPRKGLQSHMNLKVSFGNLSNPPRHCFIIKLLFVRDLTFSVASRKRLHTWLTGRLHTRKTATVITVTSYTGTRTCSCCFSGRASLASPCRSRIWRCGCGARVMVGYAHTCLKIAWSPTMARAHCVIRHTCQVYRKHPQSSVQDNSTDVGLLCNNRRNG